MSAQHDPLEASIRRKGMAGPPLTSPNKIPMAQTSLKLVLSFVSCPMTVLTQIVAPTLGSVLGLIMLFSPIRAVLDVHATKHLGDINPLPYPMTLLNCIGWVIYGAVTADPFIAPANIAGMVAGCFFTMTVFPFTSRKIQTIIQAIFILAAATFGILSMVHTFALDDIQRKQMWGSLCIALLIIYYVIPLSTFFYVIKNRDASSIYLPLAIAAVANGGLWTVYGLAMGDINIWGPNSFGAIFGIVQIVTRLIIGVKASATTSDDGDTIVKPKPAPVHFGFLRSWSRRAVYISDDQTLPSFNNQGHVSSIEAQSPPEARVHSFDGFVDFKRSKSSASLNLPPTIPEEESEEKPLISNASHSTNQKHNVHCSAEASRPSTAPVSK